MNNRLGFFLCVVYVFGIIGLAESLRRRQGYSSQFTRKVIHIGVGMLSWALPFLFDTPWFFAAACAGFMALNFLDWRYGFFAAMASSDRSNLGTVYFPLMVGIATVLFWDRPPLLVAAVMPLTWGDGLAPVVGGRYGRRRYAFYSSERTLEGSAGFFVAGWIATWVALWSLPGTPALMPATALLPALVVAASTTLIEAVSLWGLDNVTITAVAILILQAWPF